MEAVPVRGAPRTQNRTTDHGQVRFLLPCALRLQAQRRDAGRVAGLVRRLVVSAEDMDSALTLAKDCPVLRVGGGVEVGPVMEVAGS